MQINLPYLLLSLLVLTLELAGCSGQRAENDLAGPERYLAHLENLPARSVELTGEELALVYCGTCHLFPEPGLLDQKTWQEKVLPDMGRRLGMSPSGPEKSVFARQGQGARPTLAGTYADTPLLSPQDWEKIAAYYLAEAPAEPLPQAPKPAVAFGMPGFQVRLPTNPRTPLTTLLRLDEGSSRLYVGDRRSLLYRHDSQTLRPLDSLRLDSPPADLRFSESSGLDLLTMGVMDPSDQARGQWYQLTQGQGEKAVNEQDLPPSRIKGLPRPVQLAFADLNQSGREDVVICSFGNFTGRLAWYENTGGQYREHLLRMLPGARRVLIHDLNADSLPDLVALMAQGQEGIFAYYNQGGGRFKEVPLLRFPPVYGSSDFEMADFNGDGFLDILYTNGDNADYSYSLKAYHGVRIFLNDGQHNFMEAWFYPLHGASRAIAHDFDQDGKVDIAAVSFFPDFERAPHESFVYFQNQGNLRFLPQTFEDTPSGRWLLLEKGDVDGDGDTDILLGSFIYGPTRGGEALLEKWRQTAIPFLVLENKLKSPDRPHVAGPAAPTPHR